LKCVVLAGGKGTRMLPLTENNPKALVELNGKALLGQVLEGFAEAGFEEAGIVVGGSGEQIVEKFGEEFNGMKLKYLEQKEPLGTADAVRIAGNFVGSEDFVAGNADVIVGAGDLKKLAEVQGFDAVVLAHESRAPWKYGCLKTEEETLLEIVEKPEKGKEPSSLVNAGCYKFSQKIFEEIEKIEKSKRGELEITDAVNAFAEEGKAGFVKAVGKVRDIGSLEDLEKE